MFEKGFPPDWSTHKKLIWQAALSGSSLPWSTFSGNPLQFNAPKAHTLRSTSVSFSPIQDLHGYDSPWPAGGGANKINPNDFTLYTANGITWQLQEDGSFKITGACTSASSAWVFIEQYVPLSDLGISAGDTIYLYGSPRIYIFARQGTTVLNGTDSNGAVKSLKLSEGTDNLRICCYCKDGQVDSGEVINTVGKYQFSTASFSAWSPYSNECPITGWTGVNINRAGENLIFPTIYHGGFYAKSSGQDLKGTSGTNQSYTQEGNAITVTNAVSSFSGWVFSTEMLPAGNYHLHFSGSSSLLRSSIYIADSNYIVTQAVANISDATTKKDYLISLTTSRRIVFYIGTSGIGSVTLTDVQIEVGSSFTEYHPYTGETTTLTFPQTVFGGTAEVAEDGSVDVTIDRVCQTYDGTEHIVANTTYHYITVPVTYGHPTDNTGVGITSLFRFSNNATTPKPRFAVGNLASQYWFWPEDDSEWYDNAPAFKAFLAEQYAKGEPLQICYLLVTPQTIHLSSVEQLKALAGINTVWSDANGDVTVEARGTAVS